MKFFIIITALILLPETYSQIIRFSLAPEGKFIEINNSRVHYLEKGNKDNQSLLLIHGLNGSAQNFSYSMIDKLAENYHVIAVDRPGSGFSERSYSQTAELPFQAEFIANFIKNMNLNNPILVGHSLGGAISIQTALDYPELIKGLALLAPLTQYQESVPRVFSDMEIRSSTWRHAYSFSIATPRGLITGLNKMNEIFSPEKSPFDFSYKGGGLIALDYKSFYHASTDLTGIEYSLQQLITRYKDLNLPISIMYGNGDNVLDHQIHGIKMKEQFPNIDLKILEGAGHMLIVTRPDEIKNFIDDFVNHI